MKKKIIPFSLDMAKKIQAREIEGSIKTKNGLTCKIVSYCDGTDFFVERKTEASHFLWCYPYTKEGRFIDGMNNGGTDYDLALEVPENEPKFKVGDKVRVRPNRTHSHFVRKYENCIGEIVGVHPKYFMVIVTGAFQDCFSAEELELIEETGKPQFKSFDKVLVRDSNDEEWNAALFSHMTDLAKPYACVGNLFVYQCIQYAGNESLVGTTDKPKED